MRSGLDRAKNDRYDLVMSLKFKGTIFPQAKVTRNFTADFKKLRHSLGNLDDTETFFMFADATCSTRPTADIEKIHVNVFDKLEISIPKLSSADLETLEILYDKELMQEIELSKAEMKHGRSIPWKKAKIAV